MSDLYWLTEEQMAQLAPYFPKSHGKPGVDDRRVLSGIFSSIAMGCAGGMHLRNTVRKRRSTTVGSGGRVWSDDGRSGRGKGRAKDRHDRRDYLKAHRTALSLRVKKRGGLGRLIGRTKGGMNTKLHAISDANGRPLSFFMTAGQISDYTGCSSAAR